MDEAAPSDSQTPRRLPVWPVLVVYCGVFVFLFLMGGALLVGAVIIATLRRGGPQPDQAEVMVLAESMLDTPGLLLASGISSSAAMALAALVAVRMAREPVLSRLRLVPDASLGATAAAVVGFLGLAQAFDSSFTLAGWDKGSAIEHISRAVGQADGLLLGLAILFMGLGAGIGEELFFRGYMQTRLSSRFGPWLAILVTAVAFGLLHLDPVHSAYAFVAGLYLGWVTERVGSILPALAAHVINNTLWTAVVALEAPEIPSKGHGWLLAGGLAACLASILALVWMREDVGRGGVA